MTFDTTFMAKPGKQVDLKDIAPNGTGNLKDSDAAKPILKKNRDRLESLQEVLYAGATRSLLIVLQGMDTAGKDGTIRHIFTGVNPQGCNVQSFKVPTPLEARHDFLWRCHAAVPARGMIGIFNRSHYEDVLSLRVHGKLSTKQAKQHMQQIVDFESMLVDNGITVIKFFLHISVEEQKRRLQDRIDSPDKHWKLSAGDFAERKFWADYQKCYEDIFERTSTKHAPWFIIPAEHKWYRNVAVSSLVVEALEQMKLEYPKPTVDASTLTL